MIRPPASGKSRHTSLRVTQSILATAQRVEHYEMAGYMAQGRDARLRRTRAAYQVMADAKAPTYPDGVM